MDLEEEGEEVLQWRKKMMLLAFLAGVWASHLTNTNNHYWVFALLPTGGPKRNGVSLYGPTTMSL